MISRNSPSAAKLAAVCFLALRVAAQQNPKMAADDWKLEGRVFDSVAVNPIPNVTVTVLGPHYIRLGAKMDASGNYSVTGSEPGSYRVSAQKEGYGSGLAVPDYKTLTLLPGTASHADFTLDAESVISGRVLTSGKDPIPGAPVNALIRTFAAGKP